MIDWSQYDDHNTGDIEFDRHGEGQTMTDQTTKHPIRDNAPRLDRGCDRSSCVGCRYARVTGCAKTAS